MPKEINDEKRKEILDHLLNGRKIQAIKEIREVTGCGLKESKDFMDELQREIKEKYPDKIVATNSTGCGCLVLIGFVICVLAI